MENPSAILYLILGIGCLCLYRILKKKWNIQSSSKSSLYKMLFKNLNDKNIITFIHSKTALSVFKIRNIIDIFNFKRKEFENGEDQE